MKHVDPIQAATEPTNRSVSSTPVPSHPGPMTPLGRSAKVGLVLSGLLAGALICEVALRWMDYTYTPLRIESVTKDSEWRYFHSFEDEHFAYDSYLLWRPRRGIPLFNSQGYRGDELSPNKPPGAFRIFAIGDSNTLGWYDDGDANWPGYLQELLRQQDDRFTVINAGISGYSSFQGLRRFTEALSFQPDMVLISFGANDAMMVTVSDAQYADQNIRTLGVDKTLLKLRIGELMVAAVDSFDAGGETPELVPRVSLREYKENLEEIARLSKERNITVVLLTRPFIGASPHQWWWKNFAPEYNASVIDLGRERNLPVIDVYGYFDGRAEYFIDESHFTEEGFRVMARLIYERVRPLLPRGST